MAGNIGEVTGEGRDKWWISCLFCARLFD
jgi:hypothetical protein